ncbi:MAG TPA: hypothetical protein VI007_08130 [bacterium]
MHPRGTSFLGLVLAVGSLATAAPPLPDSAIVPSQGIGPYRLGMRVAEVQRLRPTTPCSMAASFTDGRVDRPDRMLAAYGAPEQRFESSFGGVRGEWLHYRSGIAFRVAYGDRSSGGLIQAIAVFRGTAPYRVRPVAPVPIPAPVQLPSPGGD